MFEIKREYHLLKEKRTHVVYGEYSPDDAPPILDGAKAFIPKHLLAGERPEKIDITITIPNH